MVAVNHCDGLTAKRLRLDKAVTLLLDLLQAGSTQGIALVRRAGGQQVRVGRVSLPQVFKRLLFVLFQFGQQRLDGGWVRVALAGVLNTRSS